MKQYFKFIALLFIGILIAIGIPLTISVLINSQSDIGIFLVLAIASIIGGIAAKIGYDFFMKGYKSNG